MSEHSLSEIALDLTGPESVLAMGTRLMRSQVSWA